MVRGVSTRCRGTDDKRGASVFATRARWRVDSDCSKSIWKLGVGDGLDCGERGNTGLGETITGNVGGGGGAELDADSCCEGVGILRGRPEAARALTTASQPFSRVLILSFSSSFSLSLAFSRSRCSDEVSSECRSWARPIPARSCLFSSSSSATLRSRKVN